MADLHCSASIVGAAASVSAPRYVVGAVLQPMQSVTSHSPAANPVSSKYQAVHAEIAGQGSGLDRPTMSSASSEQQHAVATK